jgi:hypothetical protein
MLYLTIPVVAQLRIVSESLYKIPYTLKIRRHHKGPQTSVVEPKFFSFFSDPDPTLTLISDPDLNLAPDPACL